MKRNSYVLIALVLCFAALLCGCSSAPRMNDSVSFTEESTSGSLKYSAADTAYGYDNGFSYEEEAPMETLASPFIPSSPSTALANAKLVYTADITLETTEFDIASQGITDLVASLNGYFESSYVNNYGTYRRGSYVVRVPSHSYEAFCTAASEICTLRTISRSVDNISESYYDNESRLITQKTKLERLQALLAKAENMEDIITLESAISENELAIERLTGTLRKYDSMVDFATVSISLNEVYKVEPVTQPPIGFGEKLANAFISGCRSFVSSLERTAISFAYNWVGNLIALAVIAIVVIIVVKKIKKIKKAKNQHNEEIKK